MKIIICALEFETLTGAPMYHLNIARAFKEMGHNVTCVGLRKGGKLLPKLDEIGVDVYTLDENDKWRGEYDLAIIAENIPQYLQHIVSENIFNICHSKNEADRPIISGRISEYIAPRTQISNKWCEEYPLDFKIIPIPIFLKSFNIEKIPHDKYTILAPCTRCELRKPMLLDLINNRSQDANIIIVGEDYGALKGVEIPSNVEILDETDSIPKIMARCDEVAGIFVGTVTIEAWAMDLKTSVYDEAGNWEYVEKPLNFSQHCNTRVAKLFLSLVQ